MSGSLNLRAKWGKKEVRIIQFVPGDAEPVAVVAEEKNLYSVPISDLKLAVTIGWTLGR